MADSTREPTVRGPNHTLLVREPVVRDGSGARDFPPNSWSNRAKHRRTSSHCALAGYGTHGPCNGRVCQGPTVGDRQIVAGGKPKLETLSGPQTVQQIGESIDPVGVVPRQNVVLG